MSIVHQEGIPMNDKILREFDLSYQYGVCFMHRPLAHSFY